jgi:hypothetical protein
MLVLPERSASRNSNVDAKQSNRNQDLATTQIFIEGLPHTTADKEFQITPPASGLPILAALEDRLTGFAQLIKV